MTKQNKSIEVYEKEWRLQCEITDFIRSMRVDKNVNNSRLFVYYLQLIPKKDLIIIRRPGSSVGSIKLSNDFTIENITVRDALFSFKDEIKEIEKYIGCVLLLPEKYL